MHFVGSIITVFFVLM